MEAMHTMAAGEAHMVDGRIYGFMRLCFVRLFSSIKEKIGTYFGKILSFLTVNAYGISIPNAGITANRFLPDNRPFCNFHS